MRIISTHHSLPLSKTFGSNAQPAREVCAAIKPAEKSPVDAHLHGSSPWNT